MTRQGARCLHRVVCPRGIRSSRCVPTAASALHQTHFFTLVQEACALRKGEETSREFTGGARMRCL
jgi:hypothetical protein